MTGIDQWSRSPSSASPPELPWQTSSLFKIIKTIIENNELTIKYVLYALYSVCTSLCTCSLWFVWIYCTHAITFKSNDTCGSPFSQSGNGEITSCFVFYGGLKDIGRLQMAFASLIWSLFMRLAPSRFSLGCIGDMTNGCVAYGQQLPRCQAGPDFKWIRQLKEQDKALKSQLKCDLKLNCFIVWIQFSPINFTLNVFSNKRERSVGSLVRRPNCLPKYVCRLFQESRKEWFKRQRKPKRPEHEMKTSCATR